MLCLLKCSPFETEGQAGDHQAGELAFLLMRVTQFFEAVTGKVGFY